MQKRIFRKRKCDRHKVEVFFQAYLCTCLGKICGGCGGGFAADYIKNFFVG